MKFKPIDPPRCFQTGFGPHTTMSDCGRVELAPDEQVTFTTEAGGEYDLARKDWGFYATPSLNSRLTSFGLHAVMVKNRVDRYFIMLVEEGREDLFDDYCQSEQLKIVSWLDSDETLGHLEKTLAAVAK